MYLDTRLATDSRYAFARRLRVALADLPLPPFLAGGARAATAVAEKRKTCTLHIYTLDRHHTFHTERVYCRVYVYKARELLGRTCMPSESLLIDMYSFFSNRSEGGGGASRQFEIRPDTPGTVCEENSIAAPERRCGSLVSFIYLFPFFLLPFFFFFFCFSVELSARQRVPK